MHGEINQGDDKISLNIIFVVLVPEEVSAWSSLSLLWLVLVATATVWTAFPT